MNRVKQVGNICCPKQKRIILASGKVNEHKHAKLRIFLVRTLMISTFVAVSAFAMLAFLAFHSPSMTNVRAADFSAAGVTSKMRQAQSESAAGRPQRVSLNEAEINSFLASSLASFDRQQKEPGTGVQQVVVHMVEDRINVHLIANFHGQDFALDILGILNTQSGNMHFVPLKGSVGSLPIPAPLLRSAVTQAMASPQAQRNMHLPSAISDLRVQEGQLVVQYR